MSLKLLLTYLTYYTYNNPARIEYYKHMYGALLCAENRLGRLVGRRDCLLRKRTAQSAQTPNLMFLKMVSKKVRRQKMR